MRKRNESDHRKERVECDPSGLLAGFGVGSSSISMVFAGTGVTSASVSISATLVPGF
jgi:hypothetical protein